MTQRLLRRGGKAGSHRQELKIRCKEALQSQMTQMKNKKNQCKIGEGGEELGEPYFGDHRSNASTDLELTRRSGKS